MHHDCTPKLVSPLTLNLSLLQSSSFGHNRHSGMVELCHLSSGVGSKGGVDVEICCMCEKIDLGTFLGTDYIFQNFAFSHFGSSMCLAFLCCQNCGQPSTDNTGVKLQGDPMFRAELGLELGKPSLKCTEEPPAIVGAWFVLMLVITTLCHWSARTPTSQMCPLS